MKKLGQMYRLGIWKVRPGKGEEFTKAWQSLVDWLVANHPDGWNGEASLLQDLGSSNEFISFSWSTMPEKTEELLAGAEYQSFLAGFQELCEQIQPHRMQVVGYSVSR